MTRRAVVLAIALCAPAMAYAQSPKGATYITDEEIKKVNTLPGVDRQIRVVDVGSENVAVGIVHRGPTTPPAAPAGGAPAGTGRAGAPAAAAAAAEPCAEQAGGRPADAAATGISHDSQTESYIIVSGTGTLVTGGHIVNGRKSAADSQVTKVLNGPSCNGIIAGADVVKQVVKTGDVIIIPAGVPHGWIDIADHVDYLSIRPSARVLEAGYVNPAIKK
jgi:mannose-6-phosphate isomerase-like protein (cupin superfamily)